MDARGGRDDEDTPGTRRDRGAALAGRAGSLLWRRARVGVSALVWTDPVARRLLADCAPDVLILLGRDARAQEPVVRRVPRRPTGLLVARSHPCEGVPGVDAVTTVELAPPSPDAPIGWGLTPRELEVARLVVEGLGNRAIGFQLGLATPTVGVHLSSVFKKTGATDRHALTRLLLTGGGR